MRQQEDQAAPSAPDGVMHFGLTICGVSEIAGCFDAGVTHAISILDPDTPEPGHLDALAAENFLRLRFHDVIETAPAIQAPDVGHIASILAFGRALDAHPAPRLLVHCYAGISRSTATAILLLAHRGVAPEAAVERVVTLRPIAWPNLRMIEIGDRMLKLDHALVSAVRRHHAEALKRRPELREAFRQNGRAREVDGL